MKMNRNLLLTMALSFTFLCSSVFASAAVVVCTDAKPGAAAAHGLGKLTAALEEKGLSMEISARPLDALETMKNKTLVVAGLAKGDGAAAQLIQALKIDPPTAPEALLVKNAQWQGSPILLLAGADERGLMYALLDVADRVSWSKEPTSPFSEVEDVREKPYVKERALSMYTMNKAEFENRFHDEKFWERYLDMAAKNRFNTFALLFGYENDGYFAPPYPWFFDVKEFPDVKVVDLSKEDQRRNLESLRRVIRMAHERGLDFTLGIWDHIYRGGVQGSTARAEKPTPNVVWGVTENNLTDFTIAALRTLLREVPNLEAIQFRMHGESGLKRSEMGSFWESVYKVMKQDAPQVRFDARAKNYPDSLIDTAVEMDLNFRIATKYWMEQMGMPFHPTHVPTPNQKDRRHGYADLLQYPQRYKMHWRLWNSGTTRILLWGDPDYVRQFAKSTHLYDGEGFEINEPLSTKMLDHPHDMPVMSIVNEKYKYWDWEFERQWHYYQVFGRLSYNPDASPEIWHKEFERRYGPEAAPYIEEALHKASKILPRIVAYCFPYNRFPTTRGWAEKQRQDSLAEFAKSDGSDTQQFQSPWERAHDILRGENSAEILPEESSEWFRDISEEVSALMKKADEQITDKASKEYQVTVASLGITAGLAKYHSHRAVAAVYWSLYKQSGDLSYLANCLDAFAAMNLAWESKVCGNAADVYADDLPMGRASAGLSGHWRDELVDLKKEYGELNQELLSESKKLASDLFLISRPLPASLQPAGSLLVTATAGGPSGALVELHYALDNGGFQKVSLNNHAQGLDLLHSGTIDLSNAKNPVRYYLVATDTKGNRKVLPEKGADDPFVIAISTDKDAPQVEHKKIKSAPAEKPLTIKALVTDTSGLKWVHLRYRGVNQYFDYKTLEMKPTGKPNEYAATVPGADIENKWDFMYFIEVMDNVGNGCIWPSLETEAPYMVVPLER